MEDVRRIRALTGITVEQVPDDDLVELLALHDDQVYCAAADAADRMANMLIGSSRVTQVEDIRMDSHRPMAAWRALADRLRSRCEAEEAERWDDGPVVVEFHPYGYRSGPEAVERA